MLLQQQHLEHLEQQEQERFRQQADANDRRQASTSKSRRNNFLGDRLSNFVPFQRSGQAPPGIPSTAAAGIGYTRVDAATGTNSTATNCSVASGYTRVDDGLVQVDEQKVEALLLERCAAKERRDSRAALLVQAQLHAMGVIHIIYNMQHVCFCLLPYRYIAFDKALSLLC